MLRIIKRMMHTHFNKNLLEAGVDEAGRGPLFGRVYTASAVIPNDDTFKKPFIKDSKKLSEKKREIAYDFILENAIDYSVSYKDNNYIDKHNIYNSTYDCMHNSLDGLSVRPDFVLVDGSDFQIYTEKDTNEIVPHRCIVKGDNLYCSIACASILAKVTRDNYIKELCDKNPLLDEYYDLRKNKGYGTKRHIEGIRKYGITPWHRQSFNICKGRVINKKFI